MLNLSSLLLYSVSSIGFIAVVYKILKYYELKRMAKRYFQDKVVLVTGASSGLGKAIAEEMYPLGAQVIICARNQEELMKLKAQLMQKNGKEPEVLCMDVSSKPSVMYPKIEELIKKYGKIDILINNAGVSFRGESFTTSDETFQKIMDINFFGAIRLTNFVLKHMIQDSNNNFMSKSKKRRYSIVNIGSVQSYLGIPYRSAYCSSKHALLAYSDALRGELYMHRNIDVINVQPGYINTNVSINALTSDGNKNNMNDDDHRNGFDPNYVARRTIEAILKREKEVLVVVLLHRLAIWLRFFLPNVYFWIMFKRGKSTYEKNFQ